MLADLKDAWRGLVAARGTAILAFAILALAIGAGSITYSVVYAVALRPLPFREPDRLISIGISTKVNQEPGPTTPQEYFAWRDSVPACSAIGAYQGWSGARLETNGESQNVEVGVVTANFFDVLGVTLAQGRAFTAENERLGSDSVVILSHDLWLRRFGLDANVIGRHITLANESREIVGILPAGFTYPLDPAKAGEAWIPYAPRERDKTYTTKGRGYGMVVIGRLERRSTLHEARVQAQVAFDRVEAGANDTVLAPRMVIMPLQDRMVGPAGSWLLMALAAVGFVLFVACANVASLLLSRATVRRREWAVREALGASRVRMARTMLLEGLLLSLGAALAGLGLSIWGVSFARSHLPAGLSRASTVSLNINVVAVSISAAAMCGLLFASAPAWFVSRTNLVDVLKGGSAVGGRGFVRWLRAFLVSEIGFVTVLLVAAEFAIFSFILVSTADLGFDRRNVVALGFSRSLQGTPEKERPVAAARLRSDLLERVGAVPGVTSVAIIEGGVPLTGGSTRYRVSIPGVDLLPGSSMVELRNVTPDYFSTMGLSLGQGRILNAADRNGTPLVGVINDTAAQSMFAGGDPIGQAIKFRNSLVTVVGVVRGVRLKGPEGDLVPELYLPLDQWESGDAMGTLVFRTVGASASVAAQVQAAIRPLLGQEPARPRLLDDAFRDLTADRRFNAGLMAVFGAFALLVGAIGIFGTMTFLVSQQVPAIGLRIALGATPGRILRTVGWQTGICIATGTLIGLVVTLTASKLLSQFVFGIKAADLRLYLLVAVTLAAVGFLAAFLPARRAARIDPVVALRAK